MLEKYKGKGSRKCIGGEGSYISSDGQLIIGSHVDDLIGTAHAAANLDKAERSAEKHIELDKRGRPSQMLEMELSWNKKENTNSKIFDRSDATNTSRAGECESWRKTFAAIKSRALRDTNKQPRPSGTETISGAGWRTPVRRKNDKTGNFGSHQSIRQESYATISSELEGNIGNLGSTKNEGVILRRGRSLKIKAYADAPYDGIEARSQTGALLTLRGQPIGWYSRRQDVVSLSITEAEY